MKNLPKQLEIPKCGRCNEIKCQRMTLQLGMTQWRMEVCEKCGQALADILTAWIEGREIRATES